MDQEREDFLNKEFNKNRIEQSGKEELEEIIKALNEELFWKLRMSVRNKTDWEVITFLSEKRNYALERLEDFFHTTVKFFSSLSPKALAREIRLKMREDFCPYKDTPEKRAFLDEHDPEGESEIDQLEEKNKQNFDERMAGFDAQRKQENLKKAVIFLKEEEDKIKLSIETEEAIIKRLSL